MRDRKEYFIEYRKKNKNKISEYSKNYYEKNKETINAVRKEKRKDPENKKKIKEYHSEYHKKNPHKTREGRRRRRALLRKVKVEKYTELDVISMYGTICHLCGEEINMNAPRRQGSAEGWEMGLHIDHVIPVSRGGPDTLENVRPAHAKCNLDKGTCPPIQLVIQKKEY